MECANLAGAKYITAHFKVDSFHTAVPKTAERAEQFGLHIPIHCHGGYMFGGSPDVLDHLMKIGGPRIGLCIDTAWCMQIGPKQGQPIEWAKKYADRLYGLHYKDFTFDRNAQWHDVVVGSGNLDLPNFVKTLNEVHFKGFCVIEYEADIENPVPALSKCVQQMRALAK
jgi:sugar phosphate isomerase/epimerase